MVILGGGESGTGAAILAKKKGLKVFVSDFGTIAKKYKNVLSQLEIPYEEGKHSMDRILKASEVIKSPGIPDDAKPVKLLRGHRIPIVSEIEFAARYTNAKLFCVTGSNGKTTTTLLLYHILKKAGLNVGLAGNIGDSFAAQVANNDFDYYVLEISSFQLDGMFEFKADIAIITNITPDHLNRYANDFNQYAASKFRIMQNQTQADVLIYCADDPATINGLKNIKGKQQRIPFSIKTKLTGPGAWIENKEMIINTPPNIFKMTLENLALQGKHNIYNSMAAGVAARLLDLRKDIIKQSLSDFENVEHRLEFVARIHSIDFINDSKATNVNATWYALESMQKPIIWIAGGIDKGNDYSLIKGLVSEKVKAIICLGKNNENLKRAFGSAVETMVETQSMNEAISLAMHLGNNNDTVLLSPACASFDLFENYEERGQKFKQAVNHL